ncbi:MAG TPA: DUF3445 domain-containing protein [Rhizobiaceae bacterium]|nr:DUF3445 domain-containing protein [Rhizobiaceae bacterium]
MDHLPTHTPYDGSSSPFTIGLKPLDLKDWIEVDHTFDDQMREKRQLYEERPDDVFVEEPGSEDAQREVLGLVQKHVAEHFPERYEQQCKGMLISGHPAVTTAAMRSMPALKAASLLVQEDLILMRKGEDGWRLVAGSLCFPSSWSLREKFGKPLSQIHDPVPAFGPGTRNAGLIDRMFDNLQIERPVQRWNWSLQASPALYYPLSAVQRIDRATRRPSKFTDAEIAAQVFMRVERQTLRKLPASRDILFTIRIYIDPLTALTRHPDRSAIAKSFAGQLMAMEDAQLDYKGLTADRDRLVEALKAIAA